MSLPPERSHFEKYKKGYDMNRVICQLAFRESAFFTVPVIVILLGYCLFQTIPLRHFDSAVLIFSVALGFGLGKFVFSDKPVVRSFLFSRAYSPKRFFLVRWLFGLSLIFATALLIAAIIVLGVRQSLQTGLFRNGWFPMVRFYELHVLWTFVLASLLSYHTTLFWVVRNRYLGGQKHGKTYTWLRRIGSFLLIVTALALVCGGLYMLAADFVIRVAFPLGVIRYLQAIFIPAAVLQLILMPWFGVYCYRNQEIES